MRKSLTKWTVLFVVSLLVLAGCAPRAGTPLADVLSEDQLYVDLPALVIDFDAEGNPSVGGAPLSELGAAANLPPLSLDPQTVQFMTLSGIQHIQVSSAPDGLMVLVNGMPVPSLEWDEGTLVTTAETVRQLGVAVPVLDQILPLVDQFGIGVAVRFPVPEGAETIPLGQVAETTTAADTALAREEFLAAVGTPPRINIPVVYDEEGNFSVGELSAQEWTELTGVPFNMMRLDQSLLQALAQAGITSMSFSTNEQGIQVTVNGQPLPMISWAEGEILNVLNLASRSGLLQANLPAGVDAATVIETVENLLPVIQTANANISIFLPGSELAD